MVSIVSLTQIQSRSGYAQIPNGNVIFKCTVLPTRRLGCLPWLLTTELFFFLWFCLIIINSIDSNSRYPLGRLAITYIYIVSERSKILDLISFSFFHLIAIWRVFLGTALVSTSLQRNSITCDEYWKGMIEASPIAAKFSLSKILPENFYFEWIIVVFQFILL